MITLFQVDAFTSRPFAGNPAAVCLLHRSYPDVWMQAMASEMNLAETAFVRRRDGIFELRWFTPTIEVELCGHATLAAAHALWEAELVPRATSISFESKGGRLLATRHGNDIELDFPSIPSETVLAPAELLDALGANPSYTGRTAFDWLVVVDSEASVRSLHPDFVRLAEIETRGVIVTSRSSKPEFDFVSRFFAPAAGINEDPVTGSAHCCLAPFWAERLGKTSLVGYQASPRGGVVGTVVRGDRVLLRGQAVTIFRGQLSAECEAA